MGDTPLGAHSSGRPSNILQPAGQEGAGISPAGQTEESGPRADGQYTLASSSNYQPSHQYSHQQQVPQTQTDTFNMNSVGGALPDLSYQTYGPQRYSSAPSPALSYPQNFHQFGGPQAMNQSAHVAYNMPYQAQYQGMYGASQSPSPPHLQAGTSSQFYHNQGFVGQQPGQQQQIPQYFTQPCQYNPHTPMYSGMPPPGQYGSRHNSHPLETRFPIQPRGNEYRGLNSGGGSSGRQSSVASGSGTSQSSVVRGPPRKPRQSGHAIWIGNLPPQTELMKLVSHVCKEAHSLESLFLISKSNCAFANFKDEATCTEAQTKIHDSKFQTVRLVSRLRRNSVSATAGITAPTGHAALSPPMNPPPVARSPSPDQDLTIKQEGLSEVKTSDSKDGVLPNDKFFIVKSLTVEDLELSVRNGIWATQSHNEETLNKAFQAADNVYLVFSANKSGEYFGYARMISPINDDPAAAIEFAPMAHTVEDPELPKAIPTPATDSTPKGRIIDDSARGTIFWEAERDEEEDEEEEGSTKSDGAESPTTSKAWGKPFKIEWISIIRLPFYRTRGLRNPWNSNREVKIARDGTELETGVGRRLISLFHRLPSPGTQEPTHPQDVPLVISGYPPMRPLP